MKISYDDPQFLQADALHATGLSAATLQTWVNRGVIVPASERNPGAGQRRFYSLRNLIWLSVMRHATDWGVPVSSAAQIANRLQSMFVGPELDTDFWCRQREYGDWKSLWLSISRDADGNYSIDEHLPYTIRGDAAEEQERTLRGENGSIFRGVIDTVAALSPMIQAAKVLLAEKMEAN